MTEATERDDDNPAWAPLCRRGEFTLHLLTRADAVALHMPLHADAALLAIVQGDCGQHAIGFADVSKVIEFCRDMEPTAITSGHAELEKLINDAVGIPPALAAYH